MPVSGDSSVSSQRPLRAQKPRHATFILPRTGQRLKGILHLRDSQNGHRASDEERRGLLSGEVHRQPESFAFQFKTKSLKLWQSVRQLLSSEPGIGVLKCSLAYLLGSLATFVPFLAAFLGHQDGKHVVATITVYFHPARSQGSMYKALICAFLAFIYTAFVSVTSMCVSMFFQDSLGMLALGHAIVLIVFCGGGLGFIGWTKQRLGDPLVNVACSLASLSTISVLTKEGAVQAGDLSFAKISQVLKMIVMGVTATMAVSFLIFPVSARTKLRSNLITLTETMATMLGLITESFLTGSEEDLQTAEFADAAARHKKAYSRLDFLVKEAKLEHYVGGTEKEYRLEKNLVRWVQDITHNLGGLRSAASLQFQLLKQTKPFESADSRSIRHSSHGADAHNSMSPWSFPDDPPFLQPIDKGPEHEVSESDAVRPAVSRTQTAESGIDVPLHPADIFAVFIDHLGPSMRSLAFTLKEIFKEIPFTPAPHHKVSVNSRFRTSLDRALELYRNSRNEALNAIYRRKDIVKVKTMELEADLEEVAASCGHFSFSLLEVGEQLKVLLAILDELQLESEERPHGRSWNWLKFWCKGDLERPRRLSDQPLVESPPMSNVVASQPVDRPEDTMGGSLTYGKSSTKATFGYRLWRSLGVFRRDDTRFAIKVGAGAALYALPSFIPSTRPFYSHWRGEWGLLSYMLVCSMTIGSSNTTGYARFFGTCLGAVCAILSWHITGGNVYGLAFLGWFMATWTAYIIVVRRQGPMGRFIMLTYNLSVLYAYSLSQKEGRDDQDEGGDTPVITEIVLHRVVAVFSGCIWGVIITRLIWPISARKRLKDGLALLWLRMSIIWKSGPLSATHSSKQPIEFMSPRDKLEVERFLTHLESLQASARSEFQLKQAFPDAAYTKLLACTRNMVNSFVAMNLELAKNLTASEGELAILDNTVLERRHLSSRISHLLSFMASSMKLEYPLNDNVPSIEHARDRLLARLFNYRKDSEVSQSSTDEDYSLLYAYVLVTGQLSKEIEAISEEIGRLFGVLDEDAVKLYP